MELTNIIYNFCYGILGTFSEINGYQYQLGEVGLLLMAVMFIISIILIIKLSVSVIRWIFQI